MTEVDEENIVLEGFLCPICKVDFGLDLKLFLHFQEAHGEDQDLVKSFKGRIILFCFVFMRANKRMKNACTSYTIILLPLDLFGKAKEKILKNDIVKKEERRCVWEPQELGSYAKNLHINLFKKKKLFLFILILHRIARTSHISRTAFQGLPQ